MKKPTLKIKFQKLDWSRIISVGLIVISAVVLRLVPHPPNMAPIGALALFAGAHMSRRQALAVAFGALFLSDVFLGFHATMPFVYGSFFITVLLGTALNKKKNSAYLISASFVSSVLFFIITNFGVWLIGDIYPRTAQGLVNAYAMAIPFFKNTLVGDLLFTCVFFYGYRIFTMLLFRFGWATVFKSIKK